MSSQWADWIAQLGGDEEEGQLQVSPPRTEPYMVKKGTFKEREECLLQVIWLEWPSGTEQRELQNKCL